MTKSPNNYHFRTAEVLASPDYRDRCELMYELFLAGRSLAPTPKEYLAFQKSLGELLQLFEAKTAEFKSSENELGVLITKRLCLILRRIADGLVWRLLNYDRVLIQLLAEHPKTGHLDESVTGDIELADQIIEEEKVFVLVNDLTTTLRHGDLTLIGNQGITIQETKHGRASRRNRRSKRQKRKLEELINFLSSGVRILDRRKDYILKSDGPIESYMPQANEAIGKAKANGYHRVDLSPVVSLEAFWMDYHEKKLPDIRPFNETEYVARFHNWQSFEMASSRVAPYSIFPLNHEHAYDLQTGNVLLVVTVNFEALAKLYKSFRLELMIPAPSQLEIDQYVNAPKAERMKQLKSDDFGRFIIRDEDAVLSFVPDIYGRIGLELMQEQTMVETDRQLVNLVKDMDFGSKERTRFYIGYMNERGLWV